MAKKNSFSSVLISLLVIFLCTIIFSGCATTYQKSRYWTLKYEEELKVMTEPSGCRIYVVGAQTKYKGESPVTVTLNGGDFRVTQYGCYNSNTGTTWYDNLSGSTDGGGWTIKAFCEGCKPAETRITFGKTNAFKQTIQKLKVSSKNTLPSIVVGYNSILLSPEPSHYSSSPNSGHRNSQFGGYDNNRQEELAEAKREYEQALAGYNNALRELDNAKNVNSLNNMSFDTLMSGSKLDRAVGLFNKGTSHLSVQDAERKVQIAREKLNRTKSKLDALNWK